MGKRFYYKSKFLEVIISIILLLFFTSWSKVQWIYILLISVIGIPFGYYVGVISWKKIKKRIDKRNVVILYATDSVFYAVLVLLFFIQYSPRSLFTFLKTANSPALIFESIVISFLTIWVGYAIAFWWLVRTFELSYGKLITKNFWSRSTIGPEGMISKSGIVIEFCNPKGRVRIGPEIWNAESIDKGNISVDSNVVVRDIEGITLIVEELK